MHVPLVAFVALSLLLVAVHASAAQDLGSDVPEYHAEDAGAATVTPHNLLASERFWPYQVALAEPWRPAGGAEPLTPGVAGVLIRVVEPGRTARIDFGRDGLHEVPVAATDLLDRANRVRRGELDKMAPNFVLDIGPRLGDPAASKLRPYGLRATSEHAGFLCVFADPGTQQFAGLVAALAPLQHRHGVLSILFPQGSHPDPRLFEQLRALAWPVPFVLDHLSEPYTRSLLDEGTPRPAVLLVTREGRVLFQGPWKAETQPGLLAAWDRAFGRPEAAAGGR